MKLAYFATLSILTLGSCKVVRIEGTPSVKVINEAREALPVSVENAPEVQKVAVVSVPQTAKRSKPFVKTSNNDKPIELTPSKGHYLIVDYLSAGIPSNNLPKLTIKTEGFSIDLPLQTKNGYYTYAERVQYIVLEGQKLVISTTRDSSPGTAANIYVAGNEMAADN